MVMAVFTVAAILTLVWEACFRRRADEAGGGASCTMPPPSGSVLMPLLLALVGLLAAGGRAWAGCSQLTIAGGGDGRTRPPRPLYLAAVARVDCRSLYSSLAAIGVGACSCSCCAPVGARVLCPHARPDDLRSLCTTALVDRHLSALRAGLTRLVQGGPMAPQISVTLMAGVLVLVYALFACADLPTPNRAGIRPEMPSHDGAVDSLSWRCWRPSSPFTRGLA
jgi:multicomponent Na+:H+ antiporter subunit A